MSSFRALQKLPFARRGKTKTTYTSSLSIAGCGVGLERREKRKRARRNSGKSKQSEQSLPLYSLLPRNCISLSQIFIAPLGQEQQWQWPLLWQQQIFPSKCGQPQKRSGKVVTRIRALERIARCCCCCCCSWALVLARQIKISNVWARFRVAVVMKRIEHRTTNAHRRAPSSEH